MLKHMNLKQDNKTCFFLLPYEINQKYLEIKKKKFKNNGV